VREQRGPAPTTPRHLRHAASRAVYATTSRRRGVPLKCPNDPDTFTLSVQYQVRSQDIVNAGSSPVSITRAAESVHRHSAQPGGPDWRRRRSPTGSLLVLQHPVPDLHSVTEPAGTGADTGRKGLCTTSKVTDSHAVARPTTPATLSPPSRQLQDTAAKAGQCVRAHIRSRTARACSGRQRREPVTAIRAPARPAGCEAGVCVTQHIQSRTRHGLLGRTTPASHHGHPRRL